MKYLDVRSIIEAYKGFQDSMTNKSWGYLALLKGCQNSISPSIPYEVKLDEVSNFLENIFNLSPTKKQYSGGRSLYVVFSNKWEHYFNDQGRFSPNIYDVAAWAYRRRAFDDSTTEEEIIQIFSEEFNIPLNIIKSSFNLHHKNIIFSNSLYSEDVLKSGLLQIGVDVSKNNIDAKKGGVVASPGEISRGPFVQTLYAGLEITDYVIILQSDYISLYGKNIKSNFDDKFYNKIGDSYSSPFRPYITAIKSKPFLLLAGISGTGKSRIVRELARACWEEGSEEYEAQKPRNFTMIQVKPNWHDSSELIGYVSRVSGEPMFVAGDFLKFVARAWENPDVPHFLCLDEMNLAPVEQYFAEYLSVIESRKNKDGKVVTDAILEPEFEKERNSQTGNLIPKKWYSALVDELLAECCPEKIFALKTQFETEGITIPQNLIVVGTVNMDETTFSFSRKVLDRAMTIEMNEVDLTSGLDRKHERIGLLGEAELIGTAVEGVDVYNAHKEVCDKAIGYLTTINERLENTPFKVAYRTRNEVLLYVVNNLPYNKNEAGQKNRQEVVIARALDEITNMKILSRIEGDETKIGTLLNDLKKIIGEQLNLISGRNYSSKRIEGDEAPEYSVSLAKLEEMDGRLKQGYTSFWS